MMTVSPRHFQERTLNQDPYLSWEKKMDVKAAFGNAPVVDVPCIRKTKTYWSTRIALTENSGHSRGGSWPRGLLTVVDSAQCPPIPSISSRGYQERSSSSEGKARRASNTS